jgi:hypothetical protein
MQQASASNAQKLFRHPVWVLVAAFGTYFCMYGFRKPYTAATFGQTAFYGIKYKSLLIIAQTIGYVAAKWAGIKIIAEIKREQRIKMLAALILLAELMLLFFGIVPQPYNVICLLLNGLFLGVIFGLVLGFVEGRRNTEALIAGLCASFIVSDGVSKSVGSLLLNNGISETWMPFFAGLVFIMPTALFIAMLSRVPPPSDADVTARSARVPMQSKARRGFFLKYWPGLTGITLVYLFVTLLRSIRADFAPELWQGLGYRQTPAVFTQSELLVSFGVVIINGLAIFILHHYKAFRFSLFTCVAGCAITVLAVLGLHYGLGKFAFMVLLGLGVYIPYVAIHTTIFERLIAITKERANIGFLMYIVDSVGYTGYIILMLLSYAMPKGESILDIFLKICICLGIAGAVITLYCTRYFKQKLQKNEQQFSKLATGQSGNF